MPRPLPTVEQPQHLCLDKGYDHPTCVWCAAYVATRAQISGPANCTASPKAR